MKSCDLHLPFDKNYLIELRKIAKESSDDAYVLLELLKRHDKLETFIQKIVDNPNTRDPTKIVSKAKEILRYNTEKIQ